MLVHFFVTHSYGSGYKVGCNSTFAARQVTLIGHRVAVLPLYRVAVSCVPKSLLLTFFCVLWLLGKRISQSQSRIQGKT